MTGGASLRTLGQAVGEGAERLREAGILEARREAEELTAVSEGLSRAGLWARMDRGISVEGAARLEKFLNRRQAREPLQLILGSWDFMGLPFRMRKGVFIPRPETESLAQIGRASCRERVYVLV